MCILVEYCEGGELYSMLRSGPLFNSGLDVGVKPDSFSLAVLIAGSFAAAHNLSGWLWRLIYVDE